MQENFLYPTAETIVRSMADVQENFLHEMADNIVRWCMCRKISYTQRQRPSLEGWGSGDETSDYTALGGC